MTVMNGDDTGSSQAEDFCTDPDVVQPAVVTQGEVLLRK
jgi:hypothetical protein